LNVKNFVFVTNYIKNYYHYNSSSIWIPPEIKSREFGFAIGPNKIMMRHRSFEDDTAIRNFLQNEVPLDAYHSAAQYQDPTAGIDEKGLRDADLFFDIDADHVEPNCGSDSSVWICESCNDAGIGATDVCPSCHKSTKIITFPNVKCIEAARKETIKLTAILTEDFGFASQETKVHYSGNRGFHVYLYSEGVKDLGQDARKEIIDYITYPSSELDLLALGSERETGEVRIPTVGLPGRILREIKDTLTEPEKLQGYIGSKLVKGLDMRKRQVLSELDEGNLTPLVKFLGMRRFKAFFKHVVIKNSLKVDPVVTVDLHRLVRMPGSINSKTGLPKKEVDLADTSALAILDSMFAEDKLVKIMIKVAPKMRIGGLTYGPYENLIVDLPEGIAVLLVLRGVGEIVS